MYARFFGLRQEPFSIAPDPRYLFMSERHREALAHLLYGVRGGGGFVLLSGEIGAGKTTVCRCFLEQIPKRCNVAYIFNPKLTVDELLKSVCDEFRIPYVHQGPGQATVKDYIDPLNEFLLRTHAVGQNNVLIIDEAQNLSADVLEQLRLLTNLETNERKLLQIVLIGQPELRDMLARPELEQLGQRVIARFHLEALSEPETEQYILHRLAVGGLKRAIPFERRAVQHIHRLSRGVPRRINLLCDRALLGAYAEGKPRVDEAIVEKAAAEVFEKPSRVAAASRWPRWLDPRMAGIGLGLAAGAAVLGVVTLAMDGSPRREGAAALRPALKASAPLASASASTPMLALAPTAATHGASAAGRLAAAAAASSMAKSSVESPIRSEKDAWRELAPAWKLAIDDGDPCQSAQRQQVQCFRSASSSLALIRQLGRPGILTLRDANNQTGYAVLTGLGADTATLRSGGVSQTVSLAALAEIWRGDFATFWRAPPGYVGTVADGAPGPVVDWLAARLGGLAGKAGAASKPVTEVTLRTRIHAFQLAQGLEADGRAGPMTFMQINRASGVDEPRLQTEK